MSEYIAKASIEPRDYRVVFLIQKDVGAPPTSFYLSNLPLLFFYFILLPSCLFDDKPFPTHHIHDFFHVFHT